MSEFRFQVSPVQPVFQTIQAELAPFFDRYRQLFSESLRQEIELVLVEVIQNARIHGGKPQSVRCSVSLNADALVMKVWDHNPPFQIQDKMQLPDDPYAESGRGLVIVEQLVDGLVLERYDAGNCLTLTKFLKKRAGEGTDDPLDLLYEISESIVQANEVNFDRIYQLVLDKAIRVFGVDRASIMNFDPERGLLKIVASRGLPPDVVKETQVKPGEGVSGRVFKEAKPILIDATQRQTEESVYKSHSFISAPMLCSPMRMGETCTGVINITERRDGRPFEEKDLKLLSTLANQAAAYVRIGHLIEQVKESQKMEQELGWARKIQRSLLPHDVLTTEHAEAYGYCEMARQVGGDYFDYIAQGSYLYFVIADVSGHNLPAALSMVSFRSLLRSQISLGTGPKEILEKVNTWLYSDLTVNEQQITAAIIRLDLSRRTLLYANAGHHPILYMHGETKTLDHLYADGILLGAMNQAVFAEQERPWRPTDRLLFYTDGIVDATDTDGQSFGARAIDVLLARYWQLPPVTLVHFILKEVHKHMSNRFADDDLTLMSVILR